MSAPNLRAAWLLLLVSACGEPFVLENRYPRWSEFVGACGVRTDGVLACPRVAISTDDDEPSYYVFDGAEGAPKVQKLAAGSAGLDGCALTLDGAIYCYGADEGVPQPEPGPFTALSLRRNGQALCGLREDNTLTCAATGGAFGEALTSLPPTTVASLGGFNGNAFYALDAAGAPLGFGVDVAALVTPVPLAALSCEDGGCAGLGQDGSLVCFTAAGEAQAHDADVFTEVVRLPTACCGLRQLGDVVCVNPPQAQLQPREFLDVRFAKIRYVPGIGICGPSVSDAGMCIDAY